MTADALTAELLAMGPFERSPAPYRLVQVTGPDAGDFLQRLCSQDVLALAPGVAAPAAFLDAKGKLLATCLVFRSADSFWLETHDEQAEGILALLDRYHFAEKLRLSSRPAGQCSERIGKESGTLVARATQDGDHWLVTSARRGVAFARAHGGAVAGAESLVGRPLSPELAECLRMAAGFVRVGLETEPSTLALEADLDDHCSTTKGCYTGQEIVARIHTYGHTNRKLCFLHLGAGPAITAPQPLHEREDDLAVGRVMHAVPVPGRGVRVGLGYLPKDFQAPGTQLALADGATVTVVW